MKEKRGKEMINKLERAYILLFPSKHNRGGNLREKRSKEREI